MCNIFTNFYFKFEQLVTVTSKAPRVKPALNQMASVCARKDAAVPNVTNAHQATSTTHIATNATVTSPAQLVNPVTQQLATVNATPTLSVTNAASVVPISSTIPTAKNVAVIPAAPHQTSKAAAKFATKKRSHVHAKHT